MIERTRLFSAAGAAPYYAGRTTLFGVNGPHTHHDYIEVMAIVEGSGKHTLLIEGSPPTVSPLHSGMLFLFRPRDTHTIEGSESSGVTVNNVAGPLAAWQAFLSLASLDSTWTTARQPPVITFPPGDPTVMDPLNRATRRFHAGGTMTDLIRFWAEITPTLLPSQQKTRGMPVWLEGSIDAMRREENLQLGVPRLRELTHVSSAHLARSVRAHLGVSPSELISGLRLEYAKLLLRTTSDAIGTIALRCGYSSPAHLSTSFRATTGLTPTAFRYGDAACTQPTR